MADYVTRAEFQQFGDRVVKSLDDIGDVMRAGFDAMRIGFETLHADVYGIDRAIAALNQRMDRLETDIRAIKDLLDVDARRH